MGGLCSSGMTSTLVKQYGSTTILNYVQSMIGGNMIGQQGSTLRNMITQQFNKSPQASSNPGLLDTVLNKIKGVENEEKNKMMSMKPSIP